MRGDIIGLVPVRGFRSGKTRLAETLTVNERAAVGQRMLNGVVAAALAVEGLSRVAVISPDPHALAYARAIDERVIPILQQDDQPGLNPAVTIGRDWAVRQGAAGLLVIFGDLPFLAPFDVQAVFAHPAAVVLATDQHGTGTNLSLVRFTGRGAEFVYHYGDGSARRHEAEAARLGLSFGRVSTPGAEFDLDTPDDWETLMAKDGNVARTERFLGDPMIAAGATAPVGESR